HLNPIVTHQAAETYKFGALIQNPSILYHYLLSFPYRLIELFTHAPETQVICLRLLNVALAVASLLVLRKLLKLLGVSGALANVLLLALAFTPLFMVLSAQINYDNLLILAVSATFYLAAAFRQRLARGRFDTVTMLWLLCLCLFASLIKYAFLPVFLAIAAALAWQIIRRDREHKDVLKLAKAGFFRAARPLRLALLVLLVAGGALFIRFYGVNIIRYHNPYPQCDQVLNIKDCSHYYAWENFYVIEQYNRQHHVQALTGAAGMFRYTSYWFTLSTGELFGGIVPYLGDLYGSSFYYLVIVMLAGIMLIATVRNLRRTLHGQCDLLLLLFISAVYLAFLWGKNYHDYRRTGEALAIHGRYLLPVIISIYLLLAAGMRVALKSQPRWAPAAKVVLASVVVLSFLAYGGFRPYLTFIMPRYGHLSPTNNFSPLDN
ncbi:MAG TPA: hypothetical protein VHA37_08545, partial [Candidatus Saccharimonadales bacterium]|nr:hypothetical protein [Candidatus Saccharimonadales bacterium]